MPRRIEVRAAIDGDVVFVEPVEVVRRKVHAGRDALLTEGANHFAKNVYFKRCVDDAEVCGPGVPHGEAGVVLGGEDDVSNSGQSGERGPILGMEFARVEGFGQFSEKSVGVVVGRSGEGMADDRSELAIIISSCGTLVPPMLE